MSLFAIGINHKTAPVAVRERVVFAPERVDEALHGLAAVEGVDEAAILSTCNRTELYCRMQAPGDEDVIRWLGGYHRFPCGDIRPYLYQHQDRLAVQHALRVACGLDSLIVGEPQILGQLKSAYQNAHQAGTLGHQLGRLFQHAFTVAKQIRTDTAIGASPVSVAFAAISLARQIFGDLSGKTALMIGAGETVELAVRHLAGNGIGRLIIANRHPERAAELAGRFGARAIGLTEIPGWLGETDIVIASTASQLPILGKGAVERALKRRKHRPMFMVDIAVPRDIEPEVGDLSDVYLYTVDDLDEIIEENLKTRHEAAAQADEIIETQVERFMGWLQAQEAVGTIRAYREHADRQREQALTRARRMLAQGRSTDAVLEYLARRLTNTLTHAPTHALHQAGREGRHDLLKAARLLLNLPEEH